MNQEKEEQNVLCGNKLERQMQDFTLGQLFFATLSLYEDNPLMLDAITEEKLTANVLLDKSIELSKWLQNKGIKFGDSISINSENRLEFAIVTVATLFSGATLAPLNPEYTPGELKHVLNLSKPKLVFCSPITIKKMIKIKNEHPYLKDIIAFEKDDKLKNNNIFYLNDIVGKATGKQIDMTFNPITINPDEAVATILCSSGTTGLPKGVMCTHSNITTICDIMRQALPQVVYAEDSRDSIIGLPPFFHSMGFMIMLLNLFRGKLLIIIKKFSVKLFLDTIIKYNVKRLSVPPPVLLAIIKDPISKNYDLSGIEEIRCGAAPMGKDLEINLKNKLKIKHISQGYGMTETTLVVLINPLDKPKAGSCGKVADGMKAKVINEDGIALGPNQDGELCFKGPLIMKGYIGDPIATANTIDKDGWLHTGDIAYYDDEGYFYIVDRLKELIKYKAYQVAPAELEALLINHPNVQDAAVIGLPNDEAGELPLAYVVKKTGSKVTEKDLEKYVADNVSPQKKLRGGVIFIDSIPRNPSGKILRRLLKQQAIKMKSKL